MNAQPLPTESEVRNVADRVAMVLREPCPARDIRTMAGLRQELQALRWRLVQGVQAIRSAGPLDLESQRLVNEANSWLSRFGAIEFCVAEQFEGKSRPLYPPPLPADDLVARQGEIMDRFVESLNGSGGVGAQSEATKAAGFHADVRLSTRAFLGHAHAAARVLLAQGLEGPSTFLDVGCGAGQKILLGLSFFERSDGVELDEGYAAAAQDLVRRMNSPARVFKEDALEFNGYGEYRVVYFFKPMADPAGLAQLERHIAEGVRPGTILIAPYSGFADRAESYGASPIEGAVFLAGAGAGEAEALREEAMKIGTFIAHGRPPIMVDAVWQQLVMASWMRGYNPFP